METTKIHVTNMNLHYGDFHALKNINIDLKIFTEIWM